MAIALHKLLRMCDALVGMDVLLSLFLVLPCCVALLGRGEGGGKGNGGGWKGRREEFQGQALMCCKAAAIPGG